MSDANDLVGRLGGDEVSAREEVWADLPLSAFPADRDVLLTVARAQHAREAVLEALAQLPDGVEYGSVYDVWTAIGGDTTAP